MEKNEKRSDTVFSKKIRAGRRRTYFFDVVSNRSNDYFLTITESKKKYNEDGYSRHKIFLYKEDFSKFIEALGATIDHIKKELLPEYDFYEFSQNREQNIHEPQPVSVNETGLNNESVSNTFKNPADTPTDNEGSSDTANPAEETEDLKW